MERQVRPGELEQALGQAGPGDVIILLPGTYSTAKPIAIPRGGAQRAPLVIRGQAGVTLEGGRTPNPDDFADANRPNHTRQPRLGDWCFFSLVDLEYVVFEGLTLRNCWPMAIFAQNCRYITWRDCDVTGGTFAFFVRDDFQHDERSHHLLIEGCSWIQDDTPDHKLWSKYEWEDAHGGSTGHNGMRYFNGGFFGSGDIAGSVVIRNNRISDAYNGVVFWASKALQDHENEMERRNHHILIHDNVFTRIRDNPIEPEGHIHDLRVHHNMFSNCHAWFSLDSVTGGFWYFFGNTGCFDSRQGGSKSRMGKVFKFYSEGPFPIHPVYVFNNSWYLRCPIISGDDDARHRTDNLKFFANAIEFCKPQDGTLCKAVGFVENFDWAKSDARFDNDVSDFGDFPAALQKAHQEAHGRLATGPIFTNGKAGDFSLAPGSAAAGGGKPFTLRLADGRDIAIHPSDAGVMQGGQPISVPELEDDGGGHFVLAVGYSLAAAKIGPV